MSSNNQLRPSVSLYPEDVVPVLGVEKSSSSHVKLRRADGMRPITSTEEPEGQQFCVCCGGEKSILDVVIGWKKVKEEGIARTGSQVLIAMCEVCRCNLGEKLLTTESP